MVVQLCPACSSVLGTFSPEMPLVGLLILGLSLLHKCLLLIPNFKKRELLVTFFDQTGARETDLCWEWWCFSITLSSALELQTDVGKAILDGFLLWNSELVPVSNSAWFSTLVIFIYHYAARCTGELWTSLQELVIRYPKSCISASDSLLVMSTAGKNISLFIYSLWILSLKHKDPNLTLGSSNAGVFFWFFSYWEDKKKDCRREKYGGKVLAYELMDNQTEWVWKWKSSWNK